MHVSFLNQNITLDSDESGEEKADFPSLHPNVRVHVSGRTAFVLQAITGAS